MMRDEERRQFLITSRDMVVGALTAGTLVACASGGPATVQAQTTQSSNIAAFGWEINNLGVGGAGVFLKIQRDLVLNIVDVDLSFSPLSPPTQPGFADVLCRGQVSRGGPPSFVGSEVNFFPPSSPAFGPVQAYNPGGLQVGTDSQPFQDTFLNVILKAWITTDATASQTARHVQVSPSLSLNVGDYLVFTMSGGEVTVDAEMQVILVFQ
jgi:hypothetical protein